MRSARRFRRLAAATALLATACANPTQAGAPALSPRPSVSAVAPLFAWTWHLQEYVVDGRRTDVRAIRGELRFQAPDHRNRSWFTGRGLHAHFDTEMCNSSFGDVVVDGDVLRLSQMAGTERGCGDPSLAAEMLLARMQDQAVSWAVDGDRLELATPEISLRFADHPAPSPLDGVREIATAELDGTRIRVSVTDADVIGLVVESLTQGQLWVRQEAAVGPRPYYGNNMAWVETGERYYLAAFVPVAAVRVMVGDASRPTPLQVIAVDDDTYAVAVGFVNEEACCELTSYDATGHAVASPWPVWPED